MKYLATLQVEIEIDPATGYNVESIIAAAQDAMSAELEATTLGGSVVVLDCSQIEE